MESLYTTEWPPFFTATLNCWKELSPALLYEKGINYFNLLEHWAGKCGLMVAGGQRPGGGAGIGRNFKTVSNKGGKYPAGIGYLKRLLSWTENNNPLPVSARLLHPGGPAQLRHSGGPIRTR